MEMSKYIEWLFTYMIFHYGCLAYDIDSEVCLEKPFEFAESRTDCLFTLAEAKDWFKSETGFCTKKCQVKINNLEDWSIYHGNLYTKYYQLTSLALSFNELGEQVTTIHSRCSTFKEKRTMQIICETDFENENNVVNVIFGLGGFMLGVIATVLAVIVNQKIRKGKSKTKEKEGPKTAIVNNTTFETEMDVVKNIPTVHRTNEGKNGNILSFAQSVKLSRKRNVQEAEKRSMTKNEENGDIYNHLNEKENDPDIEGNYNNVPGNLYHAMGESNYSNIKE